MLRALCLWLFCAAPLLAQTVTFTPSDADFPNPERGWWLFAADDFAQATKADLAAVAAEGVTVAYGVVRLDAYRTGPLPQGFLDDLERSFARSRAAAIKVILRFAYNYPESSQDYAAAEDAALPVVLQHIDQLAPILAANADTIVALQAGFVGAWGEWHSSSHGLTEPAAKAAIRRALRAAVPDSIPVQWRYPDDLKHGGGRQVGFHNDCFLSSPTDVGTYDEDPALRTAQRAAAVARLADRAYVSAETCDAEPEAARYGCTAVLAEAAEFHLSALNGDYYEAFHRSWRREGCREEIGRRLGYRLRLVSAERDGSVLSLRIANDGRARALQPRKLWIVVQEGGAETARSAFRETLDRIGHGQVLSFQTDLPELKTADRLCLSAPDRSPRLAGDPRQALRFANADGEGMGWDAATGAFCFQP